MIRAVLSNLGTALTALALGAIVWVVAVREGDPFATRALPSALPIEVRGLDAELVLTQPVTETLLVTMRRPESAWQELDPSTLVGCVDLGGLALGRHDVRVAVVDSGAERCREERFSGIVDRSPALLSVTLDRLGEQVFPVKIATLGEASAGYSVGEAVSQPREVRISGPQSVLETVGEVVAEVALQGTRDPIQVRLAPQPQNEIAETIAGLIVAPETVLVTIPVEAALGFKELAVKPQVLGAPAAGYYISGIDVDPATVTVAGEPEILETMGGLVETDALDVSEVQRDVARRVGLVTPAGVSPLDETVVIRVRISALLGAQRVTVTPTVEGLELGLEAEVSPSTVELLLSGPLPDLFALVEGDVVVALDLAGLDPGTYQIEPRVDLPASLQVESILPQLVQVVITAG
ncbi:MAG: YbbR-like domain-containing protein [Anaerolineae bacterium]